MVAVYFIKTCLTVLFLLILYSVQSAAVELSGKAETFPENGLIELLGKEILFHGVQIIPLNATCKDSNGEWSCGKQAWRELKNVTLLSVNKEAAKTHREPAAVYFWLVFGTVSSRQS